MAFENLVGHPLANVGRVGKIYTADAAGNPPFPLGLRVRGDGGGEYVFLQGIASLAAGDFVMYGQLNATPYVVARLLNDANSGGAGLVALAIVAALATQYAWFQVYGQQAVANVATVSAPTAGAALYRSATTGRASSSAVAKDTIFGAFLIGASVSNVGPVYLSNPYVEDQSTL